MKDNPLVSIIIPVFNGANYLAEAIESAINQTYQNVEILVINDGSNDDGATNIIAEKYKSHITYITKENGGVATALNLGIEKMRGQYFSWLSHDDLYLPKKVESQIDFLRSLGFPDAIIYSNHINLTEPSKTTYLTSHSRRSKTEFRAKEIVANNKIHGCSLLIPKSAFIEAGVFSETLRVAQDYDLWFRIADKFQFLLLDSADTIGRIHNSQTGVRLKDRVLQENDEFRLKCIKQLRDSEISALGKGSKTFGLLLLAMRMTKLGCPGSHNFLIEELRKRIHHRPYNFIKALSATFAVCLNYCHLFILNGSRWMKKKFSA